MSNVKIFISSISMFVMMGFTNLYAQKDSISSIKNQSLAQKDSLNKAAQINTGNGSIVKPAANTVKKDNRPVSQRLRVSISTSFWVNPSNSYFEFSPLISYYFPKTFSIGAGPAYVLNRDRRNDINLNGWGGKVYGRANLTPRLYAWTEYQGIDNQYISGIDPITKKISRSTEYINSWFLSMGLNIPMGKRRSINIQALYDVLYKKSNSYTYSPVTYRIGFGF
jgi:hypothetical protein